MPIENDGAAQRLARAILTDIVRYNGPKLSAASDPRSALASELAEGRALFHGRVAPSLHAIFERELNGFDLSSTASSTARRGTSAIVIGLSVVLAVAVLTTSYILSR